jgi:hypothetical protein
MRTISIRIAGADAEVLEQLLLRSVAADRGELTRLTMISTAYQDHARGEAASRQLAGVRRRMEVAEALISQLPSDGHRAETE